MWPRRSCSAASPSPVVLANQRVHASTDNPWRCQRIARQPVSLVGKPRPKRRAFRFPEELAEVPDVEHISEHLYTRGQPDPDLLIRTSGEMRVSNFLLWQIAYTELHLSDRMWPDFRRPDFEAALLAMGELRDRKPRLAGEAEPLQQLGHAAAVQFLDLQHPAAGQVVEQRAGLRARLCLVDGVLAIPSERGRDA